MTLLLILLYCFGIQVERGGWWRLLLPFTIVGLVIDVVANYTELALLTLDFPKRGEWTFSTRLARLQYDMQWRGAMARYFVRCLNAIAPSGRHI